MFCVNAKESYIWTRNDSETYHSLFQKTKKYWESVAVKQYVCQNKELRRKGSSGEQLNTYNLQLSLIIADFVHANLMC